MPDSITQAAALAGDSEKTASQAKRYHCARRAFGLAAYAVEISLLALLLIVGWSAALRNYAERFSGSPALALLIYVLLFGAILQAAGLPFEFARGFWLERRYGLSNLSAGAWARDELKAIALGGTLGVAAAEIFYGVIRLSPRFWWIWVALVFIAFFVLLAQLAPVVIFPMFFKFKPLEDASLRERLLALSERAGTRASGVFEWKLSEKSRKANAALVGLGRTRRIILADTLLQQFDQDEVECVLAHELGHHANGDLVRGLLVESASILPGLFVMSLVLARLAPVFGLRGASDFANLPLVILAGMAVSVALLPAVNAHSRRREREADAYALRATRRPSAFVSTMEKMAALNLAERRPHPWIEFLFHSHPSIEKRARFAHGFPGMESGAGP